MKTLVFVRKDTGERKEFTEDKYSIDTTSQLTKRFRSIEQMSCYRSQDGKRIDRKTDGTYQDKWGDVWLLESTN